MFTLPVVLGVIIAVLNVMAFIYVGADKKRSRQADERIPEVNFFVWAIFFASMGILAGMFFFHHKTKKLNFVFGISALLIQQLIIVRFIYSLL